MAIRRFFILVDLALAAVIVGMAVLLTTRVMETSSIALPSDSSAVSSGGAGAMRLPEVGPLTSYDAITKYSLFGAAGRFDPTATPPPEPVVEQVEVPDTDLNLRLMGTIALSEKDPFASAFIQDLDSRGNPESFLLGEDVVDNVTLQEVHKRQVILLNKRKTPAVQERLRMDETDDGPSVSTQPAIRTAMTSGTARIVVNRDEIRDELMNNYSDLLKIKPVAKRDARGNVIGLTAENISKYPLAQKLGLTDGDVLQTVNNEKIDSQAKIMELIQKHRNQSSFRIGILRDGKPRIVTYNLR